MKILKKIVWILLMVVLGLIIAAVVIPYVYKDEIVEKLKITLNEQLNAKVDFDDIDLSIISSFPNARVDIENLSVTGIDQFADTKLFQANHTMLDVSLSSLINDDIPYQLREVVLDKAVVTVIVSKDGSANYEITKESDGEQAEYILDLDKYEIKDSKITYIDQVSKLSAVIDQLNHSGSGRFTENVYDLDTYSESGNMTVTSEGVSYIKNARAKLDAIINIDLLNEQYTLKDNKLSLNELNLDADGYVKMNGDDIYVDAKIKGLEDNFRSYLSVVPNAYVGQFANVATEGKGALSLNIKGTYNSIKESFPGIDLDLSISDAFVKYHNMPQAVEDIFAKIQIDATEGDYSDLIVNIPTIKARVGDDPIEGKLVISDSTGDPNLNGFVNADIDLRNWKSAIPAEMISDMDGTIKGDMTFGAKVSDIESSNYNALALKGNIAVNDLNIKRASEPDVAIKTGTIKATPEVLDIEMQGMRYGKSDFEFNTKLKDPLMLAINTDEPIIADINLDAGTLDANEMLSLSTEPTDSAEETAPAGFNITKSKINLTAKADQILYTDQAWKDISLKGQLDGDKINITEASAMMKDNDINVKGTLNNPMGYVEGTDKLTGKLDISSNKLNMNDFIVEGDTESTSTNFLVPEDIDVDIKATIKDLTYTNMKMVNSKATIEVKDQVANIMSMTTNTLGGEIAMRGKYDSNDTEKPAFDMMLDFNKIKFEEAFEKMETMQKLAPIAKYIAGFFNSTLAFKGTLGEEMIPDLNSLNASGFVETFSSNIDDFSVLNGLGEKLGINELKSIGLENTKNWFEIVDGMVELKPKTFEVKGIDMAIAGTHGYGKDMNYFLEMKVPREMLKQNVVTGILNQGMTKIEAEAAKYGIAIGSGDYINLEVGITGSMQSPKYSIKPVGYESGGIKQAVEAEIDNQIQTVKDSVNTVITETKETIKDSVNTVVNETIDSAKTVVNTKVNEVKDSVKTILNNKVDSLTTEVGLDSLKDKVKDVLGTGADKEVDKIKDKIKGWNPWGKKKNNE